MILVDANLLIYAVDVDSHQHKAARRWLEATLSGTTPVGLAWIVLLAFLRITTRAGVFQHPITPERALDYVDSWLRQPYVAAVGPGDDVRPAIGVDVADADIVPGGCRRPCDPCFFGILEY